VKRPKRPKAPANLEDAQPHEADVSLGQSGMHLVGAARLQHTRQVEVEHVGLRAGVTVQQVVLHVDGLIAFPEGLRSCVSGVARK
jgi:hypothetical protein